MKTKQFNTLQKKAFFILLVLSGFSSCRGKPKSSPQINYNTKPIEVLKTDNSDSKSEVLPEYDKPDIDLSIMNTQMIYATVFQMLIDYDSYEDKVVRIKGLYNQFFDKRTNARTDYVLILDATACCSEGIEFILADSSIPLPPQDTPITVTGIYREYFTSDAPDIQRLRLEKAIMTLD